MGGMGEGEGSAVPRSTEATRMTRAPLQPKSGVPHCSPSVSLWGGGEVPSPTRKPHGPGHTGQCSGWSLLPSGPPPHVRAARRREAPGHCSF